jgi:arginase
VHRPIALTVYQGRAGDRNDLAAPGARSVAAALAQRIECEPVVIGEPAPALNTTWQAELAAALPALRALAQRCTDVFLQGLCPLTVNTRCAASLATLPVVGSHRPDACVVWFDAHADFNTPGTSTSGYLGGMAISGPAGLWDSGLGHGLRMSNVVLVGSRDIDSAEQQLIDAGLVHLVQPGESLAARLTDAVAGRPVYVHLDCDVLAPGIVPTDFVVEGGLSLAELHQACTAIAAQELVGMEIAEFQESWFAGGAPVSALPLIDAVAPLFEVLGDRR